MVWTSMLAISNSAKLAGVVWSVMDISQRLDMFGMAAWHIYKEVGKKGTCMTCIHDLGKEAGPLIPSTVRTV